MERQGGGTFTRPIHFWWENGPRRMRSDEGDGKGPWGIHAGGTVIPCGPQYEFNRRESHLAQGREQYSHSFLRLSKRSSPPTATAPTTPPIYFYPSLVQRSLNEFWWISL